MAPGQKPRDQKIIETLEAIKLCGWRSTNQFIQAFYASKFKWATQSLRYQPDSAYGPEHIMTAWMANVLSGDAKDKLHLSITHKAAEIMVQEFTKAYHGIFSMTRCAEWTLDVVWGVQLSERLSSRCRRPSVCIFEISMLMAGVIIVFTPVLVSVMLSQSGN
jgi:hypothetical protein